MSAALAPIPLQEVMDAIHRSSSPFSIEFCQLDQTRGTAGKLVTLPKALVTYAYKGGGARPEGMPAAPTGKTVSPAHGIHNTINLYNATERNAKKRIVKVHIRLITQFNGRDVL